ncbi:AMP-binding protein [Aquabacterium sp.]|uniref:AMP-binding protein n=1 Tax=Aquabacterium sp. TaxID=1872578 RepID=UPI0035B32FB5
MSRLLPLLPDLPDDAPVSRCHGRPVSRAALVRQVEAVARTLPDTDAAINLCLDRHWFAVGLLACIQRGILTLLPNSNAPLHLADLCQRHPGAIALGDQAEPLLSCSPWVRVDEAGAARAGAPTPTPLASRPAGQTIARFYTSGSTGEPKACDKTLGHLLAGHHAAVARIHALTGGPCPVVGTSSFRHMFGFEATVTLPLWGGGSLSPDTPFFPADVAQALADLPAPALLVTTPYHLRKMLEADIAFPRCAGLLSATAPLSPALAAQAEARFQAPLLEIYGSTELGMMATRRASQDSHWQLLDGFALRSTESGFEASGPALAQPQQLHDLIEPLDATRFRLIDRSSNLINVVGKRSSLGFLNQVLQGLPGVVDGVFCVPPGSTHHDVARLAAFVVAPGLTPPDIAAGLRAHVDPVFLPRPIIMLPALPRDANAKLPAAALDALMTQHLAAKP